MSSPPFLASPSSPNSSQYDESSLLYRQRVLIHLPLLFSKFDASRVQYRANRTRHSTSSSNSKPAGFPPLGGSAWGYSQLELWFPTDDEILVTGARRNVSFDPSPLVVFLPPKTGGARRREGGMANCDHGYSFVSRISNTSYDQGKIRNRQMDYCNHEVIFIVFRRFKESENQSEAHFLLIAMRYAVFPFSPWKSLIFSHFLLSTVVFLIKICHKSIFHVCRKGQPSKLLPSPKQ